MSEMRFGNPFHGLYDANGLTTESGVLHPEWSAPANPNELVYIDFGMPTPEANWPLETSADFTWKNDILLCGSTLRYSPQGFEIGGGWKWWLYRDPTGYVHRIRLGITPQPDQSFILDASESLLALGTTHYFFTGLHAPNYYQAWYDAVVYDSRREFLVMRTTANRQMCQSPDGTKCAVVTLQYGYALPNAGIELTASGGSASTHPTITTRLITEIQAAYYESLTATHPSRPADATAYTDPVPSWDYEYTSIVRSPIAAGYTKSNDLVVESWQVTTHLHETQAPEALPYLCLITDDFDREDRVVMTSGTYVVTTSTNGGWWKLLRIQLGTNPDNPAPGPWLVVGTDGNNWELRDPTYTATCAAGDVRNEPTVSGFKLPYTLWRLNNSLTLMLANLGVDSTRLCVHAASYGEVVTPLIGHTYPYNDAAGVATAYNPRTGAVAFGLDKGFL